jgi:hypothetical protein
MFEDTGYADGDFDRIYEAASNEDGTCGIDAYRHAYNQFNNMGGI